MELSLHHERTTYIDIVFESTKHLRGLLNHLSYLHPDHTTLVTTVNDSVHGVSLKVEQLPMPLHPDISNYEAQQFFEEIKRALQRNRKQYGVLI